MSASTTYPYDDAVPTRPTVEDLGGDDKTDDENFPPGAGEPEAAAWDNFVRLHAGAARMLPTARIGIYYNAGAPTIGALVAMRTSIAATDFVVTDNGVGDTTISWAAGILPDQIQSPMAAVNGTTPDLIKASKPTALSVNVVTTDHAGGAVDAPFTVEIF